MLIEQLFRLIWYLQISHFGHHKKTNLSLQTCSILSFFALLYLLLCFDTIEERSYAIGSFVVADCVKNGGGEIRDRFNHSIGVILSDTVSVFFLTISLHSLLDQITVNGRTQSLTWSLTVCCRRQSQCSFLHYNLNHQFRIFIIY